MFRDRRDAGERLAKELEHYSGADALVLAIPCGGVEVAYQVARHIDAELSLIVTRKLPMPRNPESGFGAVAEDGSVYLYPGAEGWMDPEVIDRVIGEQRSEIERRVRELRGGRPLPDVAGRTVIVVDDGIAMGSTMRASIAYMKSKGAGRIAVAVPVSGAEVAESIGREVDEMVVLETPVYFRAVAQVYENWYDVLDEEVLEILGRWDEERSA